MKTFKEFVAEAKMIPITHKGETIGHRWKEKGDVSRMNHHGEHSGTGMTWATDNSKDIVDIVKDQHASWLAGKIRKKEIQRSTM